MKKLLHNKGKCGKKKKKQPAEREEIFANHVFDNVLVYKIYKELIKINSKNKFDEKMGRMPK